jgi:hypothetical protein
MVYWIYLYLKLIFVKANSVYLPELYATVVNLLNVNNYNRDIFICIYLFLKLGLSFIFKIQNCSNQLNLIANTTRIYSVVKQNLVQNTQVDCHMLI